MKLNLEENFNSLDLFSFRTWGCGANQPLVAKIRMTSINMILTKTMFYSCQNIFFTCPEFMKYRRKKIFRSDLDENEKIDHQTFSYLPLRASVQSSICFKIAQMSHMLHIAMIFITVKSTYYFLHSFREYTSHSFLMRKVMSTDCLFRLISCPNIQRSSFYNERKQKQILKLKLTKECLLQTRDLKNYLQQKQMLFVSESIETD